MNTSNTQPVIAYLSPALPALSETFVYEELLALQARGLRVIPFSVRRPDFVVTSQLSLAQQTTILYDKFGLIGIIRNLVMLPVFGLGAWRAIISLTSDILSCGLLRPSTWKLTYQFLAGIKLANLLRNCGCTHLHVHFAHVPSQIAMYASALTGLPFTILAHANDIFDNGILLKQKCQRASAFLTISEFNRNYLMSIGLDSTKLAIVRCGVSFPPRVVQYQSLENVGYKLGSLGRLVEKKGFDTLLKSVDILASRGIQIQLSIAGDGPLLESLSELVETLGLQNNVHFLGQMSHQDVSKWLMDLDVFVLACKKDKNGDMDGIPVALMEAMSQSIPVVSTRLSGIPELVIHEKTGLLAEPDNAEELASQISRLLQDTELQSLLSRNAMEHVMNEFGQDKNIDRLMKYILH